MLRRRAPGPKLRRSIDRKSHLPYYVQLKQAIVELIDGGFWKPGDRIPSEPELCKLSGVSRTVVRQALQELAREGQLSREKGRGTFVTEPKISSSSLVHSLVGFYQDMAERGKAPVTEVLEQDIELASPRLASQLNLEVNTPLIKLIRLRFVEDEPIVLVTSYLPYELCPGLINADLKHQSLYAYLQQTYRLEVARGKRRIDAVLANSQQAELLGIEAGSPLLRLDSVSYLEDGTALEVFLGLFRGDRSRFEVEIDRKQSRALISSDSGTSQTDPWLS